MNKRLKELSKRVESLPFDANEELAATKAANGCFPAFIEAEKEIDSLLKHNSTHLDAKFEINKIIEEAYAEAFFEGVLIGYHKAIRGDNKG